MNPESEKGHLKLPRGISFSFSTSTAWVIHTRLGSTPGLGSRQSIAHPITPFILDGDGLRVLHFLSDAMDE